MYSSELQFLKEETIKKDEITGEFSVIRQQFPKVKYISAEKSIFCRFISYVEYSGITVREVFWQFFVFRWAQKFFYNLQRLHDIDCFQIVGIHC